MIGKYFSTIQSASRQVFSRTSYFLLAGVVSATIFVLAVWLPNLGLIFRTISDPSVPLQLKVKLPISLLGSIKTNFSVLSASYTIAIAVLFGMNLAMTIYYLKRRKENLEQAGMATSFAGFMSGMLGVGCAACGSFILSSIGAAGALSLLPLRGSEFGLLSVAFLILSISIVSKRITNPLVCKP